MNRKKLDKIWQAIEASKRKRPKLADLEKLARMCGREKTAGGKHPMWISTCFPQLRAFPIPHHGGNPEASFTVRDSVLEYLEADALAFEEALNEIETQEGQGREIEKRNGDNNGSG